MNNEYNRVGILSGSTLKIIACIFMVIDHVGLTFFPYEPIFRILGRIAFPIFAFFIAEGSRYSKHKLRRFLSIFAIGIVFFIFYFVYGQSLYGNIFLTFSVSILLDFILKLCKRLLLTKENKIQGVMLSFVFIFVLILIYCLYQIINFEYRFSGMLLPVLINLTDFRDIKVSDHLKKLDCHLARILLLISGSVFMSIDGNLGAIQYYCLLAVPLLALYNGKVGYKKLKYVFYIFYPAHLVIIEAIALIISYISSK